MNILTVTNLCKTYGQGAGFVHALKRVSFSLQKEELTAVVGESDSDKSALLGYVGALDAPTDGRITVDGYDLFTMEREARAVFRRRNIGFIFRSFQLISELAMEQNTISPLLLDYQKPDPGVMEELLEMLGLTDCRNRLPSQLSGGQQQRAAIGHALITKPSLILAGEPTGNLDTKSSQDAMDLLIRVSRHYQQTILMVIHSLGLTPSMDRALKMSSGVLFDLGRMQP